MATGWWRSTAECEREPGHLCAMLERLWSVDGTDHGPRAQRRGVDSGSAFTAQPRNESKNTLWISLTNKQEVADVSGIQFQETAVEVTTATPQQTISEFIAERIVGVPVLLI